MTSLKTKAGTQGVRGRGTDHVALASKIALRLDTLDRVLPGEPLRVLDCCAGEGVVWDRLRELRPVASYVGIDLKPRRPGTLRGDSVRSLQVLDLSAYNVIDIDTYGEPWAHYFTALTRLTTPTALFLTHGAASHRSSQTRLSLVARRHVGIPDGWQIPDSKILSEFLSERLLRAGAKYATITDMRKMVITTRTRLAYYACLASPAYTCTGD